MHQGRVESLETRAVGSYVYQDTPAGESLLLVESGYDFADDGGSVEINGAIYPYLTRTLVEDPESGEDSWIELELGAALTEPVEEGDPVHAFPFSEEKWALVNVFDPSTDGAIWARVPHALHDRLEDGVREPEDREAVNVELQGSEWVVADVVSWLPVIDGGYLEPGSVGTEVVGPQSPPEASPILEQVTPSPRGLTVVLPSQSMWNTTKFEVATDDQFSNIVLTTDSTQRIVPLTPLPARTDLYIRATSYNDLGSAPVGPAAGPFRTLELEDMDIKDLVLTVNKFKTSQHMIY